MPLSGGDIAKVLRQLAAKHGYLLAEYELLLQGKCTSCAKKNEKAQTRKTASSGRRSATP
jgi:Fe2+ or Zn2+ uptake regulation protein